MVSPNEKQNCSLGTTTNPLPHVPSFLVVRGREKVGLVLPYFLTLFTGFQTGHGQRVVEEGVDVRKGKKVFI